MKVSARDKRRGQEIDLEEAANVIPAGARANRALRAARVKARAPQGASGARAWTRASTGIGSSAPAGFTS